MSIQKNLFGRIGEQDVHRFTIASDLLEVSVIEYGARIQSIYLKDKSGDPRNVVIGLDTLEEYIANALSPAKVVKVIPNKDDKTAIAIVDDYQLSLAIGKEGQNVRLAAKLTGWKIDIKSKLNYVGDHMVVEKATEKLEDILMELKEELELDF